MANVRKKVNIGEVELRMVASAGIQRTLAPGDHRPGDHAVEAGLEQEAPPGRGIPRHLHAAPAHDDQQQHARDRVRAAIRVIGGMVATATLMKV